MTISKITIEASDGVHTLAGTIPQNVIDAVTAAIAATAQPTPPSTYSRTVRVPAGATVDSVQSQIRDDTEVLFLSGLIYPFDHGLDTSGRRHVRIAAEGAGAQPILVFRSANTAGRYPAAINAGGNDIAIDGLHFLAGDSNNTIGVQVSGTKVVVNNCLAECGSANGAGFKVASATDVTFSECTARGAYYGLWTGKDSRPIYQLPLTRNVTVEGCNFSAVSAGHPMRIQMTDGMKVHKTTIRGGRAAPTVHDLKNITFDDCDLDQPGTGPLAETNYLDKPGDSDETKKVNAFGRALTCENVTFHNCRITLKDQSALSLGIGSVNVVIDGCTITTPVGYAVNVKVADVNFPARQVASATVTNNTITGPAGCVLLKGQTTGIKQSGNTVNGAKVN